MAEALVGKILEEDYEILETYKGKDLEYKEYEPLFPFVKLNKKAYYVTCDTYVTLPTVPALFILLRHLVRTTPT